MVEGPISDEALARVYRELAEVIGDDCFSGKWFDQRAEELESTHKRVLDESHRWGKRPTLMRAEKAPLRSEAAGGDRRGAYVAPAGRRDRDQARG